MRSTTSKSSVTRATLRSGRPSRSEAPRKPDSGQKNARWEEVAGEGGFGTCDTRFVGCAGIRWCGPQVTCGLRSIDQTGSRYAFGELGKCDFFSRLFATTSLVS